MKVKAKIIQYTATIISSIFIIFTLNSIAYPTLKNFSQVSVAHADNSPIQISVAKMGPTLYNITLTNTSAEDVYGIMLTLAGGTNIYGSTTKYIPDMAAGAQIPWQVNLAQPSNGSVTIQVNIGSDTSSIHMATTLF